MLKRPDENKGAFVPFKEIQKTFAGTEDEDDQALASGEQVVSG